MNFLKLLLIIPIVSSNFTLAGGFQEAAKESASYKVLKAHLERRIQESLAKPLVALVEPIPIYSPESCSSLFIVISEGMKYRKGTSIIDLWDFLKEASGAPISVYRVEEGRIDDLFSGMVVNVVSSRRIDEKLVGISLLVLDGDKPKEVENKYPCKHVHRRSAVSGAPRKKGYLDDSGQPGR